MHSRARTIYQPYSWFPQWNWPTWESFSLWNDSSVEPYVYTAIINHQSGYRWCTSGYYIMSMASNALKQGCCFFTPAYSSAVLKLQCHPGSQPADGDWLWPQTAAVALSVSLPGGWLETISHHKSIMGTWVVDDIAWHLRSSNQNIYKQSGLVGLVLKSDVRFRLCEGIITLLLFFVMVWPHSHSILS